MEIYLITFINASSSVFAWSRLRLTLQIEFQDKKNYL